MLVCSTFPGSLSPPFSPSLPQSHQPGSGSFDSRSPEHILISHLVESFKAFFQQADYGSKLDDAVDKVKKASASFEGSVSICFQTRVEKIDKNVRALVSPIMALYFTLGGLVRDFPGEFIRNTTSGRRVCQKADLACRKSPDGTACKKRDAERGHVSTNYAFHTVCGTNAAPNATPWV